MDEVELDSETLELYRKRLENGYDLEDLEFESWKEKQVKFLIQCGQ